MSIVERILSYLEFKGVTKYKFHKDLGFSNGFLDKNREIGSDKCAKILEYFPELNPIWLIAGKGEMLNQEKEVENNILNEPREEYVVGTRQLEFENKLLKETVSMLRENLSIEEKKLLNQMLSQKAINREVLIEYKKLVSE